MNWNTILTFSAILAIALSVVDFTRNPEKYGDIMRRFDNARFYYLDNDCARVVE